MLVAKELITHRAWDTIRKPIIIGSRNLLTLVNSVVARKMSDKSGAQESVNSPCEIRIWWALACNAYGIVSRKTYTYIESFAPARLHRRLQVLHVESTVIGSPFRERGGMILFPPNMRTLCYLFDSCIRDTFQFPSVSITPRGSDVDLSSNARDYRFFSRDI